MNAWLNLSDGGWWNVAGWTMLHFMWLGTLVGLAAGVCRLVLWRSSANLRYVIALACFFALAVLPIGIGAWLSTKPLKPRANQAAQSVLPNADPIHAAPGSAGGLLGAASPEVAIPNQTTMAREPAIDMQAGSNPRQSRGLADVVASAAGYLPWAWLTGTPLTFLLLTTGVIGAERLRRSSRILDDGPIAEACAELAKSLHIGGQVTVAVCERIAAPVLIGIVRPMILLPSAALIGWSPEEIEMVLLHELAHVRRWDNLVNLLQRFVEAALFFHPAVWLVSRWVRAEREACCDAVVVGRTQRPKAYAAMLIDLAELASNLSEPDRPRPRVKAVRRGRGRPGSLVSSAMAAGPLRSRIHRILALDADPMLVSGKSLGVVMSGLLLAATLVVLNLPANGQGKESTANVTETTGTKMTGSDEGGLRLPETKYLRILFEADKENPVQTRHYPAPPALAKTLLLAFESLQRDPYGPQLDFDSRWDSDRSTIEITAPLKAHEAIFSVYIPKAIEEESRKRPDEHATGGMNDPLDDVRSEIGNQLEAVDSQPIAFTDGTLQQVPFVVGATKFAEGDRITIEEVISTAKSFEPGNHYWVKGTYTLKSRDRATLSANVTAQSSKDAKSFGIPEQSTVVERGSGEFTLELPMKINGWPHVSFYPIDGGQSFGGVYFGTGGSVLKEWWRESPQSVDGNGNTRIEPPPVRQELERRVAATNQLKDLALAMHNYHDAKGTFPANASYDTFDRPLLSWRVHILPYLDGNAAGGGTAAELYKEFHLDEPWDSEHNRALIPRMPSVFQNPNRPAGPFTSYLAVVGSDCVFDGTPKGTRLAQIPDGTANTVMLVEADDAVEWTRPVDLKFNSAMPKVGLGGLRSNGWLAVLADGSVNFFDKDKPARAVRDLFTCGRRQPDIEIKLPNLDKSVQEGADEFRPKFVPTEDNPLETRSYKITNAPNAMLRLEWTTKMLERKPGGPKVVFGYNWTDDFQKLEIVTPKAAQEFLEPQIIASQDSSPAGNAKFPTLEEQKLADLAYRRLGIELAPLNDDQLKRVKTLGYGGGLSVTSHSEPVVSWNEIRDGDLLVGLAIWPTTSLKAAGAVLNRDDLGDLSPLKFYVVRKTSTSEDDGKTYIIKDMLVTGRIPINESARSSPFEPQPQQSGADRSEGLTPQQMPELTTPQREQPLSPRVVEGTAMPIPLGPLKTSTNDSAIDWQVEQALADDPNVQMMQQELMSLQYQLSAHRGNVKSGRTRESDRLEALIKGQLEKIAAYRQQVQENLADKNTSELRYNGKTFDEWRTAWQTELSLEKRMEVVKALAAFGASGRGKEAAEAILDVANQLDWSFIGDDAAGRLKQACVDAFATGAATDGYRIPSEVWLPLMVPIVEKSGDKYTIASYVGYQLPPGEKRLIPQLIELSNQPATQAWALEALQALDPTLADERVVARFRQSFEEAKNSPQDLLTSIGRLHYGTNFGGSRDERKLRMVPELQPLLFHPDKEVRQAARNAISKAQAKDAAPLVEYLVNIISNPADGTQRREAIRALAALGKQAASAEDKLQAIAHDEQDSARFSAAVALQKQWPDIGSWGATERFNELFGPGAVRNEQLTEVSRQLKRESQEIFGDTVAHGQGGGGGVF